MTDRQFLMLMGVLFYMASACEKESWMKTGWLIAGILMFVFAFMFAIMGAWK